MKKIIATGMFCKPHLRKLDICRVTNYTPVVLLVARIADQLRIPNTKLRFDVSSRREKRDARSDKRKYFEFV